MTVAAWFFCPHPTARPRRYDRCEVHLMVVFHRVWIGMTLLGIAATTSVPTRLGLWDRLTAQTAVVGARQTGLQNQKQTVAQLPTKGGSLVCTMRSEPRTFNPYGSRDFAS
ncbi:MAG: hypothetical protein Q7T59_04350, partial [Candidatus Woesebacteria bacterium]|nr:hypothetical protein [Candidatus Woesebacteria bacterium]